MSPILDHPGADGEWTFDPNRPEEVGDTLWIIGGWGMGMVLAVWDYLRRPITEADVDAELRRMR